MDLNKILQEKEPPPGGLFRLREKLEMGPTKRRRRLWMAWRFAGALCVLILVLIWFVPKKPLPSPALLNGMDLLTQNTQQPQNPELPRGSTALLKLQETESVVYYQVIQTNGRQR